ncbi:MULTISPECIES: hypothetical protein [Bartonella]|nr:hypothetical protein [Bartonella grahamii]
MDLYIVRVFGHVGFLSGVECGEINGGRVFLNGGGSWREEGC